MNIGIIELADHKHLTYVESFARIYSAAPQNKVYIFTDAAAREKLVFLSNQQVEIIEIDHQTTINVFDTINQYSLDKAFFVTLEPFTTVSFKIAQQLLKTPVNFEINYVIHNIDFWFEQSLIKKLQRVITGSTSFAKFIFQCKKNFYYSFWNNKLMRKTLKSGGKFIVLSESVAVELSKFAPPEKIAIVPFSFYDGSVLDSSGQNKRLRICLPGYVSAVRRDYISVLNFLNNEQLKQAIELDFLGGVAKNENGDNVIELAKKFIARGAIIHLYEKPSVDIGEFDRNLAKADIVLGNLHVKLSNNVQYGKSKESGLLFTMVKAAKPGLVPATYPVEKSLNSSVLLFENYDDAESILLGLIADKNLLVELKKQAVINAQYYLPISILNRL